MKHLDRRTFLQGLGVTAAGAAAFSTLGLTARPALADVANGDLKFLFVFNNGGWDPATVFAPMFDQQNVDMEPGAQPMNIGGLTLVDGAGRPSVRGFFEQHHDRTVVINGVSVRSLSHDICRSICLTGNSSGLQPDWATRLADARRTDFTLPHLVLAGPSYAGAMGAAVARAGYSGQLDGLLGGGLLDDSDLPAALPSPAAERALDRWMSRRAAARADGAVDPIEGALMDDYEEAVARASALKGVRHDVSFTPGFGLGTQGPTAVEALSKGIARCVTVSAQVSWDTHANNATQSTLFESLFADLGALMNLLAATPGEQAASLADETVVVVLSEMGRTPRFNASQGRDHWPYTSVMVVGPGITGSRMIGGFDDRYYGRTVDPASGDIADGGTLVTAGSVGATLVELAGGDAAVAMPGETPIRGMLS